GQPVTTQSDDSQAPDDYNECTIGHCDGKKWTTSNAPEGTPCGVSGQCNASGQCTGCSAPSDCGSDAFCHTRTCVNSICGLQLRENNTPLPDDQQKKGDCRTDMCDGKGNVVSRDDDDDVPVDTDPCTHDACDHGKPSGDLEP